MYILKVDCWLDIALCYVLCIALYCGKLTLLFVKMHWIFLKAGSGLSVQKTPEEIQCHSLTAVIKQTTTMYPSPSSLMCCLARWRPSGQGPYIPVCVYST